jgi:hypothetical protein
MRDFSLAGYTQLANALQEQGIRCLSFREGADKVSNCSVCLMRHDVDVSIQCAVRLARHEAQLGITSTYFVLVNSDLYNTFSRASEAAVREIVALGHEIGLHWWRSRYPTNLDEFRRSFKNHLEQLGDLIGQPIVSAAQHDPVTDTRISIADMVLYDAYAPTYFQSIRYVSDSNRSFRTDPFQLIQEGVRHMQINLHPLYWVTEAQSMADCFREAVALEQSVTQKVLDQTLGEYEAALRDRQERDSKFRAAYEYALCKN